MNTDPKHWFLYIFKELWLERTCLENYCRRPSPFPGAPCPRAASPSPPSSSSPFSPHSPATPPSSTRLTSRVADPWNFCTDPDLRIRIRGSIPLTKLDPDPDPAIFVSDLQDVNKKKFLSCFAYYFVKVHRFAKIKSHKEVTTQGESMFFFTIFAWW